MPCLLTSMFDGDQFEKKNQNGPWKLDLDYYLFDNVPTVVLNFENMGPDTTLVLLVQSQSFTSDKSCIFIGGPFKKIIKKSTGSKSKDFLST